MEGCSHLELLADINNEGVVFTYSHWDAPVYLERYTNSDLFKTTWKQAKLLFAGQPQAWSLEKIMDADD